MVFSNGVGEVTILGIDNILFKPHCNQAKVQSFVQKDVPGLTELLPTYSNALFNNDTNTFINYPVNGHLINLNNDYGILTTDVDTQLFVGVEEPNTTLETLIILPNHNDTLFQDYGYPQYEYPVRNPGDGTVPQSSIELPGIPVYEEYDEGHGALPNTAVDDLVTFITNLNEN